MCHLFWFREPAEVWIDHIAVTKGGADAAVISPAELTEVAFPAPRREHVRTLVRDDLWLLTDAEGLDLQALAAHLDAVVATPLAARITTKINFPRGT